MSRVTESRFLSNMASVSMHITRTNMVPTMATYQSSSVVVFTFITCGHIRPWKRKRITPLSKENGSYCTYCHKAKSKHLMNHGMNMALRPLISQICLSTHRAPAAPCSCYCSCLCCFDLAPLPCPTCKGPVGLLETYSIRTLSPLPELFLPKSLPLSSISRRISLCVSFFK